MVKKVFRKKIEPGWLIISNEMYLVTTIGQSFAKFGSYNSAATEGGVTNNSDFHQSDMSF
jgi:hypothetical protein